ncbi:3716_t:CDS:2 [Acaulospora morrowiae]|uniref:3716_t:CDS:1 n=1 Tax=Acaulospora morrowiae TaxID=94023 RepID=A0A9N9DDB1_9GLOM|nr:3716_t:CDS:2 [Acaulospora morrowiae]
MDALNSERNEPVLSKSTKRNLRRKEQRRIKKARLAGPTNQSIDEGPTTPNSDDEQGIAPDSNNGQDNQAEDEKTEIFYNPEKSKQFASNMIEHFCSFTDSNNEPYTTANTASNHCQEHLACIQELIQGLQPLSDIVNNYFHNTYPTLHTKMKNLNLGPNVPKSFGAFPTIGINFNVICQFHRDLKDHRNTLCVVCPLGNFEGGELVFPELKLIVHVKQGQAVAFRSNLLVHGNLPVVAGVRHSIVFYIHSTLIKQKRKFGSLFADYELDWGNNNDDKPSQEYLPPTLGSGNNDVKLKNHRRTNIDLERAKKGLPARYKK